jgi:hypothetical protein
LLASGMGLNCFTGDSRFLIRSRWFRKFVLGESDGGGL